MTGFVQPASEATFETLVPDRGLAVVDFWASWCGPCRSFAPVFTRSAARHADVVHLSVDVDAAPALAAAFAVSSVPTVVFLRDRVVLGAVPGAMGDARLAELLERARAVDHRDGPGEVARGGLARLRAQGSFLLDVRDEEEFAVGHLAGSTNIPVWDLPTRLSELPTDRLIVCVCASGDRSAGAGDLLHDVGFAAAHLVGGLAALGREGAR